MKIQINDVEIDNAYVTMSCIDESFNLYDDGVGIYHQRVKTNLLFSAKILFFLNNEMEHLIQKFYKMDKNESILMINPNSFTKCITIKGGIRELTLEEKYYQVCIYFDGFEMMSEEVEPIITEEDKDEIVKDVIDNLKQNLTKQLAETIEKKIAEKPKLPLKRKISFE